MARKIWIHYGSDKFDPELVVANSKKLHNRCKPNGLWASPDDKLSWTWKRWCESEDFHCDRLNRYFKFRVSSKAKILWVHKLRDIDPYLINGDSGYYFDCKLNTQVLMSKFDGIVLIHGKNYSELHNNFFYTWDVDSICVWNPDVIELVNERR